MTIGAIVVNHNAGESLHACVTSLLDAGVSAVVVVDNDSRDDSVRALERAHPEIRVIETGKNLGYGSAVNIGRRAIDDDYLFVCNPDLVIEPGAPELLAEYLDHHSEAGVVGPRIYETNGSVYPSARRFPSVKDALGHALFAMFLPDNRFSRRYKSPALDATHAVTVDWVSGACLLARAAAFDAVGGFDERYFMYVEDLDLCWRLRRAQWSSAYLPSARVVHLGGLSSGQHPYRMLVAHHVSTWRFAQRSLSGWRMAMLPAVFVGIGARLVVAVARQFANRR